MTGILSWLSFGKEKGFRKETITAFEASLKGQRKWVPFEEIEAALYRADDAVCDALLFGYQNHQEWFELPDLLDALSELVIEAWPDQIAQERKGYIVLSYANSLGAIKRPMVERNSYVMFTWQWEEARRYWREEIMHISPDDPDIY